MAKRHNPRNRGMGFAVFTVLYAALALTGIYFGLKWFWGFLEAYEASRPQLVIDEYMENLTPEYIVDNCEGVLDQVDLNIQSEEECLSYLRGAVSGEFTCTRDPSASTQTRQTYVLRSGDLIVGTFAAEAGEPDPYGFACWRITEENFDLSQLMGTETISVTAPEGFLVLVNGVHLDESYIVYQENRQYGLLRELYSDYVMPIWVLQTYEAGPFLNANYQMEVYDPQGRPFTMDDNFDENTLIALKDSGTIEALDAFLEEYLTAYVRFCGTNHDYRFVHYGTLMKCIVPDTPLSREMNQVLDSLKYAAGTGDTLAEFRVNHRIDLTDGRYLADVTYRVNIPAKDGVVTATTNAKLIIVTSDSKLLVEAMIEY